MGTQSWLYYTLATWLPTLLRQAGVDAHAAGLLLAAYSLLGMPGSLLAGPFVTHRHAIRNFIGLGLFYLVGLVLLLIGSTATAITGTVMCGLTTGACLAVALTLIAHQPNPADVPAVSALAQGGGYLWAALGPVLMGALYAWAGGFGLGLVVLMVLLAAWVGAGVLAMRGIRRAEPVVLAHEE